MNDKNRIHLSKHQTTLNQTLQKQLVSLEFNARPLHADMNTRVEDYARELGAYDSVSRVEDYARELSAYDSITRVEDYARELSAYDSITRVEDYTRELSAYDSITRVEDYTRELGAYDSVSRVEDYARELGAYDSVSRVEDYARELSAYDSVSRVEDYARELSAYDSVSRIANPAVDWQEQLNLLKATQASLGFPNIIKNGLLTNPSRISTPEQHRTPLLEPSPTAITPEVYEEISPEIIPVPSPELVPITDHQKVFIVHGHDHESRDAIADFVDSWGLIPTVLDEQPSGSRTIIEKFEQCADEANFAIVLMTPDDVGASIKSRTDLKPRARQNVIFELGYFFGSKGRKRVCILYKEGVELPSDIHGVVYVPMDDEGKWQKRVIREMMDSDILIKKNKV